MTDPTSLITVGTSAGGVSAITSLLQHLKNPFRTPIAFVQHLPSQAIIDVKLIYSRHTKGTVLEIEDKMPVEIGYIYFAPPGYHVLIEAEKFFSLSQDEPVHFSRPSIDVFFESAARVYGRSLTGILLTGANQDGAQGLVAIQAHGGTTIVQNPNDAEVDIMPKGALRLLKPDYILTIPEISMILSEREKNYDPR